MNVYGQWAGNPKGTPEDPRRCISLVYSGRAMTSAQCSRKRGFGPGGLYCKQHDPATISAKAEASEAKYAAEREKLTQGLHDRIVGRRLREANAEMYDYLLKTQED